MRHFTTPLRAAIAILVAAASLTGCAGSKPVRPGSAFTSLDKSPFGLKTGYRGAAAGGLSGVNYDPASGNWVLIAGDRPNRLARVDTAR